MTRTHNFSAGPALLPESVVKETQSALWNFDDTGLGVVEMSHRSAPFDEVFNSAKTRLRAMLSLDDDQEVLFLHGGARTQFFQIPMNFLRGGRAAFLDTGVWSKQAIEEASRFGTTDVLYSSRDTAYDRVPRPGEWGELPADTRYLHYTSNNTVAGSEFDYIPDAGKAWLVCDASSDILSRPMDGSKFDLLYAGAQKNLGPSGATLVILRRSLLESADLELPTMLRYQTHVDKNSLFNTPCTFAIYVVERMLRWIESQGGVEAIYARNQAQAKSLYDLLDGSEFWHGKVQRDSRSLMNLTFTSGDPARDLQIAKDADAAGFVGLKGHKSMGGLRASFYNAQRDASVAALVEYLRDVEARMG